MSLSREAAVTLIRVRAERDLYKKAFELSVGEGREESYLGWGDRTKRRFVSSTTLRERYMAQAQAALDQENAQ